MGRARSRRSGCWSASPRATGLSGIDAQIIGGNALDRTREYGPPIPINSNGVNSPSGVTGPLKPSATAAATGANREPTADSRDRHRPLFGARRRLRRPAAGPESPSPGGGTPGSGATAKVTSRQAADVQFALGRSLEDGDDVAGAEAAYRKAIENDPARADAAREAGRSWAGEGRSRRPRGSSTRP